MEENKNQWMDGDADGRDAGAGSGCVAVGAWGEWSAGGRTKDVETTCR